MAICSGCSKIRCCHFSTKHTSAMYPYRNETRKIHGQPYCNSMDHDNVSPHLPQCSKHALNALLLLLLLRCIKRWLGDHTSCCVCKADMEEMARAVRKPSRRRRSREFEVYPYGVCGVHRNFLWLTHIPRAKRGGAVTHRLSLRNFTPVFAFGIYHLRPPHFSAASKC